MLFQRLLDFFLGDDAAELWESQSQVLLSDLLRVVYVKQVENTSDFLFFLQDRRVNGRCQKLRIVNFIITHVINLGNQILNLLLGFEWFIIIQGCDQLIFLQGATVVRVNLVKNFS